MAPSISRTTSKSNELQHTRSDTMDQTLDPPKGACDSPGK
ncbi:hypothetical protein F441_21077 [Phytophthora nicotianae CJ01A1]|uniref:Uncharacterized protein n=1 Tax=Phytophthora nicotianae CJ01A1 TaxID=1317063 RepID=W2VWJ6_PHYNI|nr:hypothetical protein F441_21077 [Phytophthora nicotianae CJ01A1]